VQEDIQIVADNQSVKCQMNSGCMRSKDDLLEIQLADEAEL
jgi:hypothetical protein